MSKRVSLTVHEQSFIDHILVHGDDTELVLLQETLNNESIFFTNVGDNKNNGTTVTGDDDYAPLLLQQQQQQSSSSQQPQQSRPPPDSTSKRLEVLEARKNCKKSVQLWKTSALKAVAANRLASSGTTTKTTTTTTTTTATPLEEVRSGSSSSSSSAADADAAATTTITKGSIQQPILEDDEQEPDDGDDDDDNNEGKLEKNDSDKNNLTRVMFEDEKKADEDYDDDDDDEECDDDDEYDEDDIGAILQKRFGTTTTTTATMTGGDSGHHEQIRMASVCLYDGQGFEVDDEQIFAKYSGEEEHYDPWICTETDEEGHKFDFHILGTSHDDPAAQPHVLTPILMNSFQPHLPDSKKGESFWLKYSLVRDGASVYTFLQHVRGSRYSLMAMETVDGEVFGAFVANAWTIQPSYFGTSESFVWRMKHSRTAGDQDHHHVPGDNLREQAQKEADIEVFTSQHLITNNDFFQLCQEERIAVGGGAGETKQDFGEDVGTFTPQQMGFALTIGEDGYLMHGSSSACLTFHSPPLSKVHPDGSKFELVNLEVWGFTPCITEQEAHMMEMRHLFFKRHATM